MRTDLERFFNPGAIAIIGASQDLNTISGWPLMVLRSCDAPMIADVPEIPDLVLILVNAARVADMLRQCGGKGVPYVIIFTSGFSEMGGEGVRLQRQLAEIARRYGIGVIGPNCQGMMNIADGVYAGFGSVFFTDYESGCVSMVS